jgi:cytochrome c oxidase cbb3-type subunit 1
MVLFGAIYYIVPRLVGAQHWTPGLIRWHFILAGAGVALTAIPLTLGGLLQGFQLSDPKIPFINTVKTTLMITGMTTLGELLLLAAHATFVINVVRVANRYYEAKAAAAYAAATADLFPAGAKS